MKKRKVIIKQLPKAQSGLDFKMQGLKAGLGFNANQMPWPVMAGKMSEPSIQVNSTLKPVAWDKANLEAEKGEVAAVPSNSGIPSTFKIGGQRHSNGGTPLNLPKDSFIFSDTRDMRIKDPEILSQFGITSKGSYTPAEIAKKYDINEFKKVLADPDTDDLQRKTAEGMIANYNLKLAKLALIQESMKGFPQGLPRMAMPYIESMEIDPSQFIQMNGQPGEQQTVDDTDQMQFGGIIDQLKKARLGINQDFFQSGGSKVVQPRRSDRVILNPATGEYEVYNMLGRKIGVLNVPQAIQQPMQVVSPQAPAPVSTATSPKPTKKQNIPANAVVIKRSDYETDAEYIAARDAAYADHPGQTIYTQDSSGVYSKVVSKKGTAPGNTQQHVDLLNTSFSDPKVQQELYNKTIAAMDKEGTLGKNPGFTKADVEALGPQGLANQFLEMQTRNLETRDLLDKAGVNLSCFDNNTGAFKKSTECKESPYKNLDEVFAQTSVGVPQNKGIQQLSYIGYNDLVQDARAGKLAPEVNEMLKPFQVSQYGVSDENLRGTKGTISKADSFYTNTTTGQIAGVRSPDELAEEAVDAQEEGSSATTKAEHLNAPAPQFGAPWWLQDIVKTAGAAYNLASVKKYPPWQATPAVFTPEMTFHDPSRQLAAIAEQSRIGADTLAQFAGPRAFNARFNQLQGQGAKAAADTLAQYHNLNVGLSNQQQAQNAQIMNEAAARKAQQDTTLWDKYQTMNQQFDNSKAALRDNLLNQYVNAVTNKNYTANLNKLYPQFAVNPAIGGEMYLRDPRALQPDFSQSPDFTSTYNKILEENPTLRAYPEKVADIAMKTLGMSTSTPEDAWLEYQKNRGIVPSYPSPQGGEGY